MAPCRDLHPHAGPRPDLRVDQLTEGGTGEPADRAVYRAIYRAMPVAGLPDELQIGTVSVFQTMGPVLSQFTEVRQRPGLKLLFDKEMRTAVPVGASQWLTVGQLEVDADSDASREFPRWRDTVSEAIGLLAAVLDERVALELLSENVVYLSGGKPVQSADMRQGLRNYLPYEARGLEVAALHALAELGSAIPSDVRVAARWYLKGAQAGPVADAIIYFWVALEALTPGEQQSVKSLETMLVEAGWDMEDLDPELGRMAGLRAAIVHDASEEPTRIREGFYRLEATVRVLLRRGLGVSSSWPPAASTPTFVTKSEEIEGSWAAPVVAWHDEMPAATSAVSEPQLDWVSMVGPPLTEGFDIEVQAELPKHWSRKIEIYTALAAEALGPAFDGQPLCVVVEEFPSEARATARVNAARISLDAGQFRSRDRKREGRVAQALFGGVPQQQLMRRGVDTDVPLGAYLLDLAGGFCEYHAFVASGFVAAEDVGLPQQIEPADLKTAAELCGAALAGNQPARELVQHWIEAAATDRSWAEVTTEILDDWKAQDPHTVVGMALTAWAKINE